LRWPRGYVIPETIFANMHKARPAQFNIILFLT
jgi:hypothetical protein